jgi:L-2-hydroxyglutarate oxidase LhgO
MESVEVVVVGAGVIGLAIARKLASEGREVIIVEAANSIGTGVSSRNSEVIHAGIYYPRESLKAVLCAAGRERIYAYCAARNIPHARTGKVIVATDESQIEALHSLYLRGIQNGVPDLALLGRDDLRSIEPALNAVAGIMSPNTGIIDSHALMLSMLGEAEEQGASLALRTPIVAAEVADCGIIVHTGGDNPITLMTAILINAAGLSASDVARCIVGFPRAQAPVTRYVKGNYFTLSGTASPFRRLIYPLPDADGLGVHLTLDLSGQTRFGPDADWIDALDYGVDCQRLDQFYTEIRRYWPSLPDGALIPAYAGIRPRISARGAPSSDFLIQGPRDHGINGLVNLFGIESPGLSSCLAIADHIVDLI